MLDRADSNPSHLDKAVHTACDPIIDLFTRDQSSKDTAAGYVKEFAKTAPLFMAGKVAMAALAATYALDEIKLSDQGKEIARDAGLGLAKGASLAAARNFPARRNTTPSLMGVELGIINRASQTALSRDNYLDRQGNFNLCSGLKKTALNTFNPLSMASDFVTFGAADVTWGLLHNRTRGTVLFNPAISRAVAGGAMGLSTGLGMELSRQTSTGQFDGLQLVKSGLGEGAVMALAGAAGGYQAGRLLSLKVAENAATLQEARSSAVQTGKTADSAQTALRDGDFHPQSAGLVHQYNVYTGSLVSPDGKTMPAIFRADDGSEAFKARMQAEIATYRLNPLLAIKADMPATVQRTIEVGGRVIPGYIQELKGDDLATYMLNSFGNRDAGIQAFKADGQLQNFYKNTAVRRQLVSSWDNHAKNDLFNGQDAHIIDIDRIMSARTALDFIPHPGHRNGSQDLASHFYQLVQGEPITPEAASSLSSFVSRYDHASGTAFLKQELGITEAQALGIVGRAKWFDKQGILPHGNETPVYFFFRPALRNLRDQVGRAARWLKPADPATPQAYEAQPS